MNYLTIFILLVILVIIYNMHKTERFAEVHRNITAEPKEPNKCDKDEEKTYTSCIKKVDGCPGGYIQDKDKKLLKCHNWRINKICPEDEVFDLNEAGCKKIVDSRDFKCPEGYEMKGGGFLDIGYNSLTCEKSKQLCPDGYEVSTNGKTTKCCPKDHPKLDIANNGIPFCKS